MPLDLVKGAWYALVQCGLLLEHARILYDANGYSTSIAVALFAREELGRHRKLIELWKKSENDGVVLTAMEVREACKNHVEKQRYALLSMSYTTDRRTQLAKLLETRMRCDPQSPEWKDANRSLEQLDELKRSRVPDDRHLERMSALYVDPDDSGIGWNRPSEISELQAYRCLNDAANDYANRRDRLHNFADEFHPKLPSILEAWRERPHLPPPSWPSSPHNSTGRQNE